jgi:hypothetical protein
MRSCRLRSINWYVVHDLRGGAGCGRSADEGLPNSDSAPMAYIIGGRTHHHQRRIGGDVDTALASFDRVPRLFPGSDAVAAARFFAGERCAWRVAWTNRSIGCGAYRWNFRAQFGPRAPTWRRCTSLVSPRSGAADVCPAAAHPPAVSGTPEAAGALNYGTMLYRLYVRGKTQPPLRVSAAATSARRRRASATSWASHRRLGRVLLGHKNGIAIFDDKGTMARSIAAAEPRRSSSNSGPALSSYARTRSCRTRDDVPGVGAADRTSAAAVEEIRRSSCSRMAIACGDKNQKNVIAFRRRGNTSPIS